MLGFLSFFVALSISHATETPFPKNWCSTGNCSAPQKKIWNEFNAGDSPNWISMPQVFSGSCYHSSYYYDNKTEHFSGFLIDAKDNSLSLNGRHSFFSKKNPYADLNLNTAREIFKNDNKSRIEIFEDYGFYNATPEAESPVRSWFREGSDSNIKMAVIFGTLDHFILCDLSYHQKN